MLVAAALIAAGIATPAPEPGKAAACETARPHYTGGSAGRLDRQPTAALILTVARSIDGCLTPVIVRTGIGATPRR